MFWIKLGLCVYIPKQCHNVIMEMILPPFLSLHYLLLCNCGPCLMLHYPFILNLNYNLCCVESVHKIWCNVLTSQLTTISFFNFETFCLKNWVVCRTEADVEKERDENKKYDDSSVLL